VATSKKIGRAAPRADARGAHGACSHDRECGSKARQAGNQVKGRALGRTAHRRARRRQIAWSRSGSTQARRARRRGGSERHGSALGFRVLRGVSGAGSASRVERGHGFSVASWHKANGVVMARCRGGVVDTRVRSKGGKLGCCWALGQKRS